MTVIGSLRRTRRGLLRLCAMATVIVLTHIIGMLGTVIFWGANPRAPIGG